MAAFRTLFRESSSQNGKKWLGNRLKCPKMTTIAQKVTNIDGIFEAKWPEFVQFSQLKACAHTRQIMWSNQIFPKFIFQNQKFTEIFLTVSFVFFCLSCRKWSMALVDMSGDNLSGGRFPARLVLPPPPMFNDPPCPKNRQRPESNGALECLLSF